MNKALKDKIEKLIEEEEQKPVDQKLLDKLRSWATEPTDYLKQTPEESNALNTFFKEVKALMLRELMTGNYGADIITDSMIVLSFEVGVKYGMHLSIPRIRETPG